MTKPIKNTVRISQGDKDFELDVEVYDEMIKDRTLATAYPKVKALALPHRYDEYWRDYWRHHNRYRVVDKDLIETNVEGRAFQAIELCRYLDKLHKLEYERWKSAPKGERDPRYRRRLKRIKRTYNAARRRAERRIVVYEAQAVTRMSERRLARQNADIVAELEAELKNSRASVGIVRPVTNEVRAKFFKLELEQQLSIVLKLGLVKEEDRLLSLDDLLRACVERAPLQGAAITLMVATHEAKEAFERKD